MPIGNDDLEWIARLALESLNHQLPSEAQDYAMMNDHAQLESCLVHVYNLTGRTDELTAKAEKELPKDEAERNSVCPAIRRWPSCCLSAAVGPLRASRG